MSDFTYQSGVPCSRLENFEWDNTWIEQTNKTDVARVLYIGDSISCGTRRIATERANGKYLFDGFGTSKGLDNPYFRASLLPFTAQQPRRDVILFNNGLHGWHLDDENVYRRLFDEMLTFLQGEYAGTPLYVVLTTSVDDPVREARVRVRNRVATALAAEHGLPVIDLYAASVEIRAMHTDGVHFSKEGYAHLADCILNALE